MDDKTFKQFEEFIHARSVALIGTSPSANYYWLRSFLNFDFRGKLYPVNPTLDEALGLKCYKSLSEVPDPVDYAILRVPAKIVPSVLDECIAKGVKCATIFTSGFSELGTEEGKRREAEITEKIRASSMRVFGPNCMGLCCPETRFSFRPDLSLNPGSIGFIAQSGGKAIDTYLAVEEAGEGCSKVFSFGNEIDISSSDLVEYLARDNSTKVIGMYLEGARDGQKLREALTATAPKKPVVVWKAGNTIEGARAVASHSAALAGSAQVWDGLLHQTGVAMVNTFEHLIDTMVAFLRCPPPKGNRVAFIAISGGAGVVGTDILVSQGFKLPTLTQEKVKALGKIVQAVGTNIRNPIDLASSYFYPDVASQALRLVAEDDNIDAIILEAAPHYIEFMAKHLGMKDYTSDYWKIIIEAANYCMRECHKPFLVAVPAIGFAEENLAARRQFREGGLPISFTTADAASTLRTLITYYKRHPNLPSSFEA
jgi:acyl-CoA synthetase (NDP forming)